MRSRSSKIPICTVDKWPTMPSTTGRFGTLEWRLHQRPYTLAVQNFKMDNRVGQKLPARVHQSPARRQLRHVSSSSAGGDDGNGDIHAWLALKIVALWVLGAHGEHHCAEWVVARWLNPLHKSLFVLRATWSDALRSHPLADHQGPQRRHAYGGPLETHCGKFHEELSQSLILGWSAIKVK